MNSSINSNIELQTKITIFNNIRWNWIGIALETAMAFIICPFLISFLGAAQYGVWVTIGAITGYFGLFDFGIKSSVGRYVAYYQSKNQLDMLNGSVQTSILLLASLSTIALTCIFLSLDTLVSLISKEFTETQILSIRTALLISGIHLWVLLPLNAFEGILWGCQRFDYLNKISAPATIIRGIFSILFVWFGYGLVSLSLICLITTLVTGIIKIVLAKRLIPSINFSFASVKRLHLYELAKFGAANSLRSFSHALPAKLSPIGIAILIGVETVAPMSIAARLIAATTAILVAAAGVLTPLATSYHAKNNLRAIRQLHLTGGRYLYCAGLFVATLFFSLGQPLIRLWVGPELDSSYYLLLILACGRCFSATQIVTRAILTAQAKQWPLAYMSIVQSSLVIGLGFYLLSYQGLYAFVILLAVADFLSEGVFSLYYGCRCLNISIRSYLKQSFLACLSLVLPSTALILCCNYWPADNWFMLFFYGVSYSLSSLLFFLVFVEPKFLQTILVNGDSRHAISN